jgi:hypothetical protein
MPAMYSAVRHHRGDRLGRRGQQDQGEARSPSDSDVAQTGRPALPRSNSSRQSHYTRTDLLDWTARIDSVVMAVPQPQASDEAVIWYDEFDGPEKAYTESQGPLDDDQAFGGQGPSMLSVYERQGPDVRLESVAPAGEDGG